METKTRTRLSVEQLHDVCETAMLGEPYNAMVMAWDYILGYSIADHPGQVTPWMYEIPTSQWEAIIQACMAGAGGDGSDRVCVAMDWVNIGPSAYDDDDPA